jgi:ketosteroid isomerase-like protein
MANTAAREEIVGEGEIGRKSAKTREVLRLYHDAFRNHRPEALVDIVGDDCVLENVTPAPDGSRHAGKAACLEVWQGIAGATDRHFEHEEIFVAGDRIVTRWRLRWGDNDGQSLRGLNFMRVKDGKIIEAYGYAKR